MIPKLFIPRELEDAAREEARHIIDKALDGMFGLIQAAVLRRQSYAFAAEKAVYHDALVKELRKTKLRIVGRQRKIKRHERLAIRWRSVAKSRDPRLAQACGLYACEDSP